MTKYKDKIERLIVVLIKRSKANPDFSGIYGAITEELKSILATIPESTFDKSKEDKPKKHNIMTISEWSKLPEEFDKVVNSIRPEDKECKLVKTLVAIPDGYQYVEIHSISEIKAIPIKNIPDGHTFNTVIFDEIIQPKLKPTPTPSPIEFEEIETLKRNFIKEDGSHNWKELSESERKINKLIRNQNKIITHLSNK